MRHVNRRFPRAALFMLLLIFFGCVNQEKGKPTMMKETYGKLPDGTAVDLYTLANRSGMEVKITNYGGIIVSIKTPDRNGRMGDVVLGYDNLDGYVTRNPFFGCLVGRYGNRIGKARFSLSGVEYKLASNNGQNHLHGGLKGFDKQVWQARALDDATGLELKYLSKDGEEGYPGNLSVTVTYTLGDDNSLKIDYLASTDKETVLNLTNHSYFNLAGEGDILGHEMMIDADRFTPVDSELITTGELRAVAGTPFDFLKPTPIGARIDADDEQIVFGKGYDHNFVLNHKPGEMGLVARVYEPKTGRQMEVFTTEPGVQFYTGNFLDGSIRGKSGRIVERRSGFCLETQHFPDSPNKPQFPSPVLKPGETYKTSTSFRFSAR
ncbi:MAG: galactose mutarotase [Acidobacteria bacterium]|nr:galactose mutarotase [Acidobacteriota bacterium]